MTMHDTLARSLRQCALGSADVPSLLAEPGLLTVSLQNRARCLNYECAV